MNELAVKLKETNLEEESSKRLEDIFMPYFKQAEEWKNKAKDIMVTDESQVEEMKIARESRLALKNIRCDVEKKRKSLKEESLRYGKAVDGMANVIKFLIAPIENHCKEQEEFVRIRQEKRLQELEFNRKEELINLDVDVELYDLRIMSEEKYSLLLEQSKKLYNDKIEAEKALEKARIEEEKRQKEENERIRKENERLKKEAEERDRIEAEKQKKLEAEREKERKKQEDILKKEREKHARLEAELLEKKRIEQEESQKRKEAEEKAKEEERQKELAPDKDKLNELALRIVNTEMPEVKDDKAKEIIENVVELLNKTSNYIKNNVIKL